MADLPIPFSAPMVRALLAGTKTQTRRILKTQPPEGSRYSGIHFASNEPDSHFFNTPVGGFKVRQRVREGDRLYVREHWRAEARLDKKPPRDIKTNYPGIKYIATDEPDDFGIEGKFRQGMHMPRWASRLTLIVTNVRVERLQDITEVDAIAEGADISPDHRSQITGGPMVKVGPGTYLSPIAWYRWLWNQINGAGSWETNPWVVAYTFEVIKGNIDQIGGGK